MSLNQFRTDRSDAQLRKHGRPSSFSYQRNSSGASGKGGGAATAPPISGSSSTSFSSNQSFKKSGSNVQGAQFKVHTPSTKTDQNTVTSVTHTMQNDSHIQSSLQGHEPVSGADKLIGTPAFKSSQALPRATAAQSTSGLNHSQSLKTPSKDEQKGFPLQFGSISPGFVNGMQIPARTSSAPPNLVEQKLDQARHDFLRTGPTVPIPATPKQQLPQNNLGGVDQSTPTESHPSNQARDAHVQIPGSIPPVPTSQKTSVHPIPGMSMAMPYQQPQVAVQFGGPTGQIHPQGVTASSLQMPMPLSVGNTTQVQAPVFVSGLQSHPLQTQGMMHQAQGLGFPPQMSHQLGQRLSNLGMAMPSQFSSQQPGKYAGPRKTTVKITHPETHEELRLDKRADLYLESGSSGARSHPSAPSQSQPIPSFSPAQINFYGSTQPSYNSSPIFFQTPSSFPITSTQMTPSTAASRYTYPVGQGGQTVSFMNASTLNSIPLSKSGLLGHGNSEPVKVQSGQASDSIPAASVQVSVKPAVGSFSEMVTGISSVTISAPPNKGELFKPQNTLVESNLSRQLMSNEVDPEKSKDQLRFVDGSASSVANMEGRSKEHQGRSESLKDQQEKTSRKDPHQADLPKSGESLKSSSWEGSDDSGISTITDVNSKEVSKSDDNVEGPSISVESSTSESCTHSLTSEDTISSEVGQIKAEVYPTLYSAETSGGNIEAAVETSQDLDSCNRASETETNEVQVGEGDSCEPSNLSGVVMDACKNLAGAPNKAVYSTSTVLEYLEGAKLPELASLAELLPIENHKMEVHGESNIKETEQSDKDVEQVDFSSKERRTLDNLVMSAPTSSSTTNNETASLSYIDTRGDKTDSISLEAATKVVHEKGASGQEIAMADQLGPPPVSSEMKNTTTGPRSFSVPGHQTSLENNRPKGTPVKKKKRRELLMKADAAGSTFDLYNAFKGPEEKPHQNSAVTQESLEYSSVNESDKVSPDDKDPIRGEEDGQSKGELDDWEDAAISTPELKGSENEEHALGARKHLDKYRSGMLKYSRDFLLTISKQCVELPAGFDIEPDVADALMNGLVSGSTLVDRDSYPNSGRVLDRSSGGSRVDRCGGIADDDKWSKSPSPFTPGIHVAAVNFRPGQGVNNGVLRNPRGQPTGQYIGGMLSGPLLTPQGGMHRNNPDTDWWQRATGFQKGLIPSPQTPLQVMHKAEKKYEVGKVSDEEEAKQRQLKGILNKLTPQNFDKLFEQVKVVNIDNAMTLTGVISQIFDKALTEPTFCEMYADFCFHLAGELPDFNEDNEKITFKRVLLNKCQEEFERGEREQAEANRIEEDGEIKQTEEEREVKKVQARRRMLGNIRLIGELYKKKMLTERIMHECIKKLLGQYQNPDEEDVEALCKLMTTIGEMIDHPKAKEHMDAYFEMMSQLSTNQMLSSRVRFMLKDAMELRKNKWQLRRKIDGPKKIEEVHRDAAQERQLQTSRLSRGPSMGSSARRGQQPMDYGPRGSNQLSSSGSQQLSGRGFPSQFRGYGAQDARFEERSPFERTLSVPLTQRPMDDDSLTLGPQGGLGKRLSSRGQQPIMSNVPSPELYPGTGDHRRMGSGPNGYTSASDHHYSSWEEPMLRVAPDRFMNPPAFDQSSSHDRNLSFGNKDLRSPDRAIDRSWPTSPALGNVQGRLSGAQTALESEISEDKLQETSIATIREFYSARNEEKVRLCIKDLKSPKFYPSMVMLWVTDSFDRKNDIDRDLLAKLLVDLCKSRDCLLSEAQLMKGFESVLSTLEDTVTDSPKAAEYLGRIFGKVVLENVVPLAEIERLIHGGGEEPGSLLQSGLAADVLASLIKMLRHERGDPGLMDIRAGSNLQLEDFRPPDLLKARKLNAFI
ncbi:eukaryotic translation initiation factor 4G-like isoform X2 [Aristolochia californica]|uniref:eukaryotic translation initiation factor 4G-like isoform X2 n=1 Tax=Aristolochia californica TaxID=171875 RepID=UPI0035DB0055